MDTNLIQKINYTLIAIISITLLTIVLFFHHDFVSVRNFFISFILYSAFLALLSYLLSKIFNEIEKYVITLMLIFPLLFSLSFLYKSYQVEKKSQAIAEKSREELAKKTNEILVQYQKLFTPRVNAVSQQYMQEFNTLDKNLNTENLATAQGRAGIKQHLDSFVEVVSKRNNLLGEGEEFLNKQTANITNVAFLQSFRISLNKQKLINQNINAAEKNYINALNILLAFLDKNQNNLKVANSEITFNNEEDTKSYHQLIFKFSESKQNLINAHNSNKNL